MPTHFIHMVKRRIGNNMAAKRKKKVDTEDEILVSLKERYFRLIKNENIGKTHQLTLVIDKLESVIRKRMEELKG